MLRSEWAVQIVGSAADAKEAYFAGAQGRVSSFNYGLRMQMVD